MGCGSVSGLRPFHEAFELQEVVGKGRFGEVYSAVERASREPYALRVIPQTAVSLKELLEEGKLWRSMSNCKYIVQWFTIRAEGNTFFVIMEKCQCTFLRKLQTSNSWNLQKTADAFRQMLRGVAWVHASGVVHRNIKASNFLCGGEAGYTTMKLTDFSCACAVPRSEFIVEEVGSAQYRSVEMVGGVGYSYKTDVWSFGVMAYALLFGEFPYAAQERSSEKIARTIWKQSIEPRFIHVPAGDNVGEFLGPAARFCRVLLRRNPDIRCSAAEALQLGFITGEPSSMEMEGGKTASCNQQDGHREVMPLAPPVINWAEERVFSNDSERSEFSQKLVQKEIRPVPLISMEVDVDLQ